MAFLRSIIDKFEKPGGPAGVDGGALDDRLAEAVDSQIRSHLAWVERRRLYFNRVKAATEQSRNHAAEGRRILDRRLAAAAALDAPDMHMARAVADAALAAVSASSILDRPLAQDLETTLRLARAVAITRAVPEAFQPAPPPLAASAPAVVAVRIRQPPAVPGLDPPATPRPAAAAEEQAERPAARASASAAAAASAVAAIRQLPDKEKKRVARVLGALRKAGWVSGADTAPFIQADAKLQSRLGKLRQSLPEEVLAGLGLLPGPQARSAGSKRSDRPPQSPAAHQPPPAKRKL